MTTIREVKCPLCGRLSLYAPTNPYRPFCSERCRLIDLGEWADGKYAIPVHKEAQSYQEESGDEDEAILSNNDADGDSEPES
ncbi:MAG: DNA gyrase inhibitor YacG [Bdellovibrionaceae bacterium]|nr:DNA gyrase inhibitor YacG [Bdellovibrio sp.]